MSTFISAVLQNMIVVSCNVSCTPCRTASPVNAPNLPLTVVGAYEPIALAGLQTFCINGIVNNADVPAVRFGKYKKPWRLCQFSEIFTERHIIDTISDKYPQLAFTIEEGVIRPEDKKTNKRDFLIIDKATKKYLQTEYDDIIYNPANVIYGAIHRNALGKGCVSPIYKIFYTDQDSTFMECIVRHPRFIKEISRSMEGTVKKLRTLKPKAFLEMSAYIAPTIEEQQQIGEYFRQMDRLIEIEKEELEKIKHIKSACLEKMFV